MPVHTLGRNLPAGTCRPEPAGRNLPAGTCRPKHAGRNMPAGTCRPEPAGRPPAHPVSGGLGGCARAAAGLEPGDQLVEAELLEALGDGVELSRAELDEAPALLAELERLPQPGLARVEAPDDLLNAGTGGLVGEGGSVAHDPSPYGRGRTDTRPSWRRRVSSACSRAAAAEVTGSPAGSSTRAYPRSSARCGSWAARASARRSRSRARWARSAPAAARPLRSSTSAFVEVWRSAAARPRRALARSSRPCWCSRARWRATWSAGARESRASTRARSTIASRER